jgi:predicted TIM-barrel fold metal-dependent hydrolase
MSDAAIEAIDVHVHVATGDALRQATAKGATDAAAAQAYFGAARLHVPPDEVAEHYRRLGIRAVIFDVDQEAHTGMRMSNDDIAAAVRRHPDVFIGFGSVDPNRGQAALDEARRCVEELGLKGMKFHPGIQAFAPNDQRFYPLWGTCSRLGVPVIFHTGMSGIGAGQPGGGGIRLKYTQPLLLDDVGVDFPELTIIAAHPSWPWADEMLAIARHKRNVVLDLSGYSPKYIPPQYVQFANTLLQDQMVFGSDYPFIPPERWLADFQEAGFRPQVHDKILRLNAQRALGLT